MSARFCHRISHHLPRYAAPFVALSVFIACAPALAESGLQIKTDPTAVSVHAGDRLVMQYRYAEVPFKPYIKQFLTPAGINVLRDAPHDHLHHHALMFAVGVDNVDFWGETPKDGRQAHKALSEGKTDRQAGLDRALFTESIDWTNTADNAVLLKESRTIVVYHAQDLAASLLTWQSDFILPPGKSSARIWGRKYFGLGVRFLTSMDKGDRFQNADGRTGVAGTNAAHSPWCAYSADADGKPVTLAMFDHPDNPRHPAAWYTMGDKPNEFAYMTATLNLEKEPLLLEKPTRLRYGVALWDGHPDRAQIDALYRRWLAP